MSLQAVTCPGYYETEEGQVKRMPNLVENIAILHEVEEEIRVLCINCVEGKCNSVCVDAGVKKTGCVFLKPAYKNTPSS